MKSIEDHIEKDKNIVDDPLANPAARRHAKEELHDLVDYAEHHKMRSKQEITMILMHLNYGVISIQKNLSV